MKQYRTFKYQNEFYMLMDISEEIMNFFQEFLPGLLLQDMQDMNL